MPIQNIAPNAILAAQFTVKFRDIFNLKDFYRAMHEWMVEYEWSSTESDGLKIENKDYFDTLYLEKQGLENDKEMWWWWRLQRLPTDNSYYKYLIDIDFHILYTLPTEVMRDGKKLQAHKGEVEIKLWAYIQFDYKGEWSKHPILKMFNKTFPRRIFKKDLYSDHKLELYREAYVFQSYIKKWLKIRRFLPFEEITPFRPSAVYPEWKKE